MKEFDLANYPPQRITANPWYDDYTKHQHQTNMCMMCSIAAGDTVNLDHEAVEILEGFF